MTAIAYLARSGPSAKRQRLLSGTSGERLGDGSKGISVPSVVLTQATVDRVAVRDCVAREAPRMNLRRCIAGRSATTTSGSVHRVALELRKQRVKAAVLNGSQRPYPLQPTSATKSAQSGDTPKQ
jgi:hypothetical protein